MVKSLRWVAVALGGLIIAIAAAPGSAQVAEDAMNPGICGINDYSGRLVIDERGQAVPLDVYCRDRSATLDATTELLTEPSNTAEDSTFWQTFRTAASPPALKFAATLGREQVTTYALSICNALSQGESLDTIRQVQSDGSAPQSFEAVVTVAAIHSFCPAYQNQLGRQLDYAG